VEIYLQGGQWYYPYHGYAIEFNDNGDSVPETLTQIDSIAETGAAVDYDTALIGTVPTDGVYPAWKVSDASGYCGYVCIGFHLIKWNFTNA